MKLIVVFNADGDLLSLVRPINPRDPEASAEEITRMTGGFRTEVVDVLAFADFDEYFSAGAGTCRCGMWPISEYGHTCPSCPKED